MLLTIIFAAYLPSLFSMQMPSVQAQNTLEQKLNELAITEGYGYKYGNLQILTDRLRLKKPTHGYELKVPEFTGMSSNQIKSALERNGFSMNLEWRKVVATNFPERLQIEQLYENRMLPELFLKSCEEFRGKLLEALEKAKDDTVFDGIREFVASNGSKKLMVRSTGKEDSKELSNAGGNESIANVTGKYDTVFEAIGRVLESYFGEKSLLQRLRANDRSVLDQDQLTPVLIQVMAGAADKTTVTQCGVMFTEEPNMGAFTKDAETTGISIIQSAYGHNESIVLGLVPFDTFYVDSNGNIFPIIRKKTDRMVPSETSGELELVANGENLAKRPSLSEGAVKTLKFLADELEGLYHGPMDVEFVVTDDPKEVLIVQARPIIKRVPDHRPSYFKPQIMSRDGLVKGQVILHGGSYIRQCTEQSTIVAKKITEAYNVWTKQPKGIQCIILGDLAPETSHEATIFRTEGIAVIQVDNFQVTSDHLKTGKHLLFSPQQECLLEIDGMTPWNDWTKEGWYSFPAPKSLSVIAGYSSAASIPYDKQILVDKDQFTGWRAVDSLAAFKVCKLSNDDLQDHRSLLQTTYSRVVDKFLQKLLAVKFPLEKLEPIERELTMVLDKLWRYTELAITGCPVDLDSSKSIATTANHLLHYHFTMTLINQAPVLNTVGSISYNGLLTKKVIPLIKVLEKYDDVSISRGKTYSLLWLAENTYTDVVHQNFVNFILNLDKNSTEHEYESFYKIAFKIFEIRAFPLWVQTNFRNPVTDPTLILSEYYESIDFINLSLELNRQVRSISPQSFSRAKSFEKSYMVIEHLARVFSNSKPKDTAQDIAINRSEEYFIDMFKEKASQTARIIAIKVMSEFVELVDFSIKAIKNNDEVFPNNYVPALMKARKMVKLFYVLLDSWYSSLLTTQDEKIEIIKNETFPKIYAQIRKTELDNRDYYFSPGFRVSSASFYSSSSGGRTSDVKTLEDAYSLTHQNLQYVLSKLMIQCDALNTHLPDYLNEIIEKFEFNKVNFFGSSSAIIGIEMNMNDIVITANQALRTHGLLKKVIYNRNHPNSAKIVYWYSGLGQERHSYRWHKLLCAYTVYRFMGTYTIDNIEYDEKNGFGLEIVVNGNEGLESLAGLLSLTSTFTNNFDTFYEELDYPSLVLGLKSLSHFIQSLIYIIAKSGRVPDVKSNCMAMFNTLFRRAYRKDPFGMIELGEVFTASDSSAPWQPLAQAFFDPILRGPLAEEALMKFALKGHRFLPYCFQEGYTPEFIDQAVGVLIHQAKLLMNQIKTNDFFSFTSYFRKALTVIVSEKANDLVRVYTAMKRTYSQLAVGRWDAYLTIKLQLLYQNGKVERDALNELAMTEPRLYKGLVEQLTISPHSSVEQVRFLGSILEIMSNYDIWQDPIQLPWIAFDDELSGDIDKIANLLFRMPQYQPYKTIVPLFPLVFYQHCYKHSSCRQILFSKQESDSWLPLIIMVVSILEGDEPILNSTKSIVSENSFRYLGAPYDNYFRDIVSDYLRILKNSVEIIPSATKEYYDEIVSVLEEVLED